MDTVWILSTGENNEGGDVIGVYADRDLARGQLITEAHKIRDRFNEIRDLHEEADGSIHFSGGCDWLSLKPHQVVSRQEIERGGEATWR